MKSSSDLVTEAVRERRRHEAATRFHIREAQASIKTHCFADAIGHLTRALYTSAHADSWLAVETFIKKKDG